MLVVNADFRKPPSQVEKRTELTTARSGRVAARDKCARKSPRGADEVEDNGWWSSSFE